MRAYALYDVTSEWRIWTKIAKLGGLNSKKTAGLIYLLLKMNVNDKNSVFVVDFYRDVSLVIMPQLLSQ